MWIPWHSPSRAAYPEQKGQTLPQALWAVPRLPLRLSSPVCLLPGSWPLGASHLGLCAGPVSAWSAAFRTLLSPRSALPRSSCPGRLAQLLGRLPVLHEPHHADDRVIVEAPRPGAATNSIVLEYISQKLIYGHSEDFPSVKN